MRKFLCGGGAVVELDLDGGGQECRPYRNGAFLRALVIDLRRLLTSRHPHLEGREMWGTRACA